MKITFLGTCAGTEPMAGRRHSSFVVEHGEALYWFDAGESCVYTAHLLGIDLLTTRTIFISYRIEANGKSVVFSGDVADTAELEPLLGGVDLLLTETGYHAVEDVCVYLRDSGLAPGRLGFIHHGRAILSDPDKELEKARSILGGGVFLAADDMALEV